MTLFTMFLGLYLRVCDFNYCRSIEVKPEVIAVTTCESGDTENLGTIDWDAVSVTGDTGAFQFSPSTWKWLTNRTDNAKDAPQSLQLITFYRLWDNGYGWTHWNSSKACWSKWMKINRNNQAVWR